MTTPVETAKGRDIYHFLEEVYQDGGDVDREQLFFHGEKMFDDDQDVPLDRLGEIEYDGVLRPFSEMFNEWWTAHCMADPRRSSARFPNDYAEELLVQSSPFVRDASGALPGKRGQLRHKLTSDDAKAVIAVIAEVMGIPEVALREKMAEFYLKHSVNILNEVEKKLRTLLEVQDG